MTMRLIAEAPPPMRIAAVTAPGCAGAQTLRGRIG
ncbi:hypothetical protein VIMS_00507 [Mycobacterium marinum]|nr:hypothetical protein VIMS_00507 [Mycobacterium marinum]